MDFLETQVELGEAEGDGVLYGDAAVSNFLEEEEDDTDLADYFSGVSSLSGEELGSETAYRLRERNQGGEKGRRRYSFARVHRRE